MATGLLTDPRFLDHCTGQHPERPERLLAIRGRLDRDGLTGRCTPLPFAEASDGAILRLHDLDQLQLVEAASAAGGGQIEADTVVSPASFAVAKLAVGAATAAVDAVVAGTVRNALALVRPPGHHATADTAMGFCLFNTVALAADHARRTHGMGRVMIVDWDVHHGNGTQDIFFADGTVWFFSSHRYGRGFYPGTGAAAETGDGAGAGATRNLALPLGTPPASYREQFVRTLDAFATEAKPELILVSAGFDAHRLDPVGGLGFESDDYAWLTDHVAALADQHCGGRLVSLLEGGYHLDALAESVAVHLGRLLAAGGAA